MTSLEPFVLKGLRENEALVLFLDSCRSLSIAPSTVKTSDLYCIHYMLCILKVWNYLRSTRKFPGSWYKEFGRSVFEELARTSLNKMAGSKFLSPPNRLIEIDNDSHVQKYQKQSWTKTYHYFTYDFVSSPNVCIRNLGTFISKNLFVIKTSLISFQISFGRIFRALAIFWFCNDTFLFHHFFGAKYFG